MRNRHSFVLFSATPGLWNPTTIALTVAGVTALIVLLALGLAKALTVKARGKGQLSLIIYLYFTNFNNCLMFMEKINN